MTWRDLGDVNALIRPLASLPSQWAIYIRDKLPVTLLSFTDGLAWVLLVVRPDRVMPLASSAIAADCISTHKKLGVTIFSRGRWMCPLHRKERRGIKGMPDSQPPRTYASCLLTIEEACTEFKIKRTSFWGFRARHDIPTLTCGKVHRDDVIRGFEDERNGGKREV